MIISEIIRMQVLQRVFFDNEDKLKDVLKAESVGAVFNHLKKEVEQYYGEGNQD